MAYVIYEANTDSATEAEYRGELAAGDPTAGDRLERRERQATRAAAVLWPAAGEFIDREAER